MMAGTTSSITLANIQQATFQPTLAFRWLEREATPRTLQQLWADMYSSDAEWRDIEIVTETATEKDGE